MPSQTPEEMFADKSYEGWEELSPRQKVERMFSIHKSGREEEEEGEEVSLSFCCFSISVSAISWCEKGKKDIITQRWVKRIIS